MSISTLLTSLFRYKSWANEELFSELMALGETVHQEELHSALRLLNHIYIVDQIFAANLQGKLHGYKAINTPETPSLDELYQRVKSTDQWYLEYVTNLRPEQFSENLRFFFVDDSAGTMSREEMLMHVVTHGGYHRGGVGKMMTQLSVAPSRDAYTKFLHVSEPIRSQEA